MGKKPVVNKQKCIGCGACVAICPDDFEMGSDGKASAKLKAKNSECAKTAANNCPVGAIGFE